MPLKDSSSDEKAFLAGLAKFETAASVEAANVAPYRGVIMRELFVKAMRKVGFCPSLRSISS